jgi:pimeloyl-ACP methyl ester carboxylesterase
MASIHTANAVASEESRWSNLKIYLEVQVRVSSLSSVAAGFCALALLCYACARDGNTVEPQLPSSIRSASSNPTLPCQPLPTDAPEGPYAPCDRTILYQVDGPTQNGVDVLVLIHGWIRHVDDWLSYYNAQGIACTMLGYCYVAPGNPSLPGQVYFRDLLPQLAKDFPNAAIYVYDYESFRDYDETGRSLATLLTHEQRQHNFSRVVLIGHSMGGLVARVAGQILASGSYVPLKGILALASPNLGTPLPTDIFANWAPVGPPGVSTDGGASLARSLAYAESAHLYLYGGDISNRFFLGRYGPPFKRLCNQYGECVNDGAVPLSSALAMAGPNSQSFNVPSVTRHAVYPDYDHSEMKGGKTPLASDRLYLDIIADLQSLLKPPPLDLFNENGALSPQSRPC